MRRIETTTTLLLTLLMSAAGAPADEVPADGPLDMEHTCRFRQPWTPPAAAHKSRVVACGQPDPDNIIALDDFECDQSGDVVRVRWWGVLLDPQQINRTYYIAIWSDNGACEPDQVLYSTCVIPQSRRAARDCTDKRVLEFRAQVPPFQVNAGERYWLQISEDDANSANAGVDDFLWSGRQPARLCDAVQIDANGEIHSPLIDACNGQIDDLSFEVLIHVP
jgi:hypothetical protein